MAIARGLAATAMFAGLAVGAAGTAWADTPTMNGSYTLTSTTPAGWCNLYHQLDRQFLRWRVRLHKGWGGG